jgi:hypothetical protein
MSHCYNKTQCKNQLRMYFSKPGNSSDVCFTKSCVLAAASLLDSMDEEEDPCDDFYSFVCGGFIDKAEIPEHSGVHSTLGEISAQNSYRVHKLLTVPKTTVSQAEQQLRDFYSSKRKKLFCVFKSNIRIGIE